MSSAAATEYREIAIEPEEELDFRAEELSPRMQELLSDFDAGLDRAIAKANRWWEAEPDEAAAVEAPAAALADATAAAEDDADPVTDAALPAYLVKVMNGVYNDNELTPEHYAKAEARLASIDWDAAADIIDLDKPLFSRAPNGSHRHGQDLIHFANEALNAMTFESLAERQELAGHAARALLGELADPALEMDPPRERMLRSLEHGLTVEFSSWHPERGDPHPRLYRLLMGSLNDPNSAEADEPIQEVLDAYDLAYAAPGSDSTRFTADRYQNESSLGPVGQALVNDVVAALRERYPETIGYPGLGEDTYDEEAIKRTNSGYAVEAIWKDLQKAFQAQDFLNEGHFKSEAAALAAVATDGADPTNPAAGYLQTKLADWLADRSMTDEEWGQRAAELNDAAQAAALWQERCPGEPLDWAALIELRREEGENFPPTLFLMQTAANYAEALQAMGLDETTDLQFGCMWRFSSGVEPRYDSEPQLAWPVMTAYMGLMHQSYVDNAELLTHAAGLKESFLASAGTEVREQRRETYAETFLRLSYLAETQEELSGIIAEQIRDGGAAAFPQTYPRLTAAEGRVQFMQLAEQGEEIANWALQSRFRQLMAGPLRGMENVEDWRNPPADARFDYSEENIAAMAVILDLDRRWREKQGN